MKKRTPIPPKTKKYLQKEINSECPICENQEVGHFEIHHIDENPSNNEFDNLLMLCPICHSKITKKEITTSEVVLIKSRLSKITDKLEFVNVFVKEELYNWKSDLDNSFVFNSETNNESISPHLILNWSFINHSKKTILLKQITYSGKYLPAAMSGPPIPYLVTSIIKYKISLNLNSKRHIVVFSDQLQIPKNQGVQFQIEFNHALGGKVYPLGGRFYFDIIFEFSNNQRIEVQRLFFNCKSENERLKHYLY